jgi:hypothetical protein
MEVGRQEPIWLDFYEKAWKARAQYIQSRIEAGEKDPFAIMHQLNRFESSKVFGVDRGSGAGIFHHVKIQEEDTTYPTGRPFILPTSVGETFYQRPFYQHQMDFLLDYIDGRKFSAIVELGAGYGQNLIDMQYKGGQRNIPYYAGEYTESGRELTETLGKLNPALNLKSFFFDHKAPNLDIVKEKSDILVFSCHSIEQVTEIPANYFKALSNGRKNVLGIHFEPFGHQINIETLPRGEVSAAQQTYFEENKWNRNFAEVYLNAVNRGEIEQIFVMKNIFSGHPNCPSSLAIWKSVS